MDKHAQLKSAILGILYILVLLIPGCAPEDKRLDFDTLLPERWKPYAIYRLDTNLDGKKDWAILYTYDEKEKSAFTPVGGVIYHADRGEPPVVYPYPLIVSGWPYLGEGKSRIELKDVIQGSSGPEVVFSGDNSDGITTRIAIFRWEDRAPNKLLPPEADETAGQWYHCIGQFIADTEITLGTDQVTVWDSTDERSQLAIRKIYRPQNGSYIKDSQPIPPVQTCLDFAHGQPKEVDKSPYPEKIMMAFYTNLGTERVYQYMTQEARNNLQKRTGDWAEIASLSGVCVKEISYIPDAESQVQQALVIQAEQTRDAQKTVVPTPATCAGCPQAECTCSPTPTRMPTSDPVWIDVLVEYGPQDQPTLARQRWGIVQAGNVWRIAYVEIQE